MSLLNPDLETRILQLTKSICGDNCSKCKHSLVKNLENRARFLSNTKKRTLQIKDDSNSYHDAIEYDTDSLPRKYRKYTLEQHRRSLLEQDTKKIEEREIVPEDSKKRKKPEGLTKREVDEELENIKKRILEKKEKKDETESKSKVDEDKNEKELEKSYYNSLKNVDIGTVTETMRTEAEPPVEQYRDFCPSPQSIEISPVQHPVQHPVVFPTAFPEVKPVMTEMMEPERKDEIEIEPTMTSEPSISMSVVETHRTESPKQAEVEEKPPETQPTTSLFGKTNESIVKSIFAAEIKPADPNKSPFDFLDKINVPIPKGNPLFAPKEQESSLFKPKTDGANFVFGQSQSTLDQSSKSQTGSLFGQSQSTLDQGSKSQTGSLFGSLSTGQSSLGQQLTPQLVIPGFGQTVMPQSGGSNPFAGQFFKSRRGRGRGRGR